MHVDCPAQIYKIWAVQLMRRFKSNCLATLALFALLAGQLAVLGHAIAEDHSPGEVCEICVSTDRLTDGLISANTSLDVAPLRAVHAAVTATRIHARFAHIVRSRGPPSL